MGLMRFVVSPPGRLTADMVEQCFMSGLDRIPWKIQPRQEGDQFIIRRGADESTNLHIPWDVPGQGRLMLSTASLVERPEPYPLPLELARGKIGQLRNQLAEWQALGLMLDDAAPNKLAEALALFGRAAITADDWWEDSAGLAERALTAAVEAGVLLSSAYTEQAIAVRRRIAGRLPVFFGANLGNVPLDDTLAPQFLETFGAAVVPLSWRELEAVEGNHVWETSDRQLTWCKQQGLKVCGGPLVPFERQAVPDWLSACQGKNEELVGAVTAFVERTVERYRGQVDLWLCASRIHAADFFGLSEEQCLRLAARTIEITRTFDPETPVLISFDQPWGEYLSRREMDFPPLQFAESLVRAGLGLSGIVLEMNLGYHPGGTLPRDAVDLSRQLDYWAALGLPLHVALTIPSAVQDDPLATRRVTCVAEPWSPGLQQAWVARWLPMLLAKPYVAGIYWSKLHDAEPHEFPHGGLFDLRRSPKPVLRTLGAFRQSYV